MKPDGLSVVVIDFKKMTPLVFQRAFEDAGYPFAGNCRVASPGLRFSEHRLTHGNAVAARLLLIHRNFLEW